jgi:vesicular inhibitory amino acid transporter
MPIAFGVVMSAYEAHAVFPSLYRGMRSPNYFPRVIYISYIIMFVVYSAVATMGYLMFGALVEPQITANLNNLANNSTTTTVDKVFSKMALVVVVINPICKYALEMNPFGLLVEKWFLHKRWKQGKMSKRAYGIYRLLLRTILTGLSLVFAVIIPSFLTVLGIIGAFFGFFDAVLFPTMCFLRLYGNRISLVESIWNYFLLVFGVLSLIIGTVWAILAYAGVIAS